MVLKLTLVFALGKRDTEKSAEGIKAAGLAVAGPEQRQTAEMEGKGPAGAKAEPEPKLLRDLPYLMASKPFSVFVDVVELFTKDMMWSITHTVVSWFCK